MALAQTTLNGAIANGSVTTATVRDVLGFASSAETSDLVQIESEYLLVGGGLGTTSWSSITRGYAGSTAAAHIDGSTVTRLERGYTDATRLHTMAKAPATDDAYLRDVADQANSWLNAEVGYFHGPSTDTIRSFDLAEDSTSLIVPGGLRSFSKVEIKLASSDTSWIDVTVDILLRPQSWDLVDGLAANQLIFTDLPSLGYSHFYAGFATARVTSSTFGPATPPNALRRIADTVGVWLYQSRAAGAGGIIGSIDTGELVVNRVLTPVDFRTLQLYRVDDPWAFSLVA